MEAKAVSYSSDLLQPPVGPGQYLWCALNLHRLKCAVVLQELRSSGKSCEERRTFHADLQRPSVLKKAVVSVQGAICSTSTIKRSMILECEMVVLERLRDVILLRAQLCCMRDRPVQHTSFSRGFTTGTTVLERDSLALGVLVYTGH